MHPVKTLLLLAICLLLAWPSPAGAVLPDSKPGDPAYQAFFPTPEASGEVAVTLHPNRQALLKPVVAGFGVPFPPGFVSDPGQIRLKDPDGQDLPLFVTVLSRWPAPAPGAGSIRSALVQFLDIFYEVKPYEYTLSWGRPRPESEPQGWPPRTGWVKVQDGSLLDGLVEDPPVFAVFPSVWLGRCLLKDRIPPAGEYKKFSFYDEALRRNFKAAANIFESHVSAENIKKNTVNYTSDHEPWLYDRAASFFVTYIRMGGLEPLRQAHRAAQYYALQTAPDGRLGLLPRERPADPKYASPEGLAMDYWLTGDPGMVDGLKRVLKLLDAWNHDYRDGGGHWTERHLAASLLTALVGYEVLDDGRLLEEARLRFETAWRMQNKPSDGGPVDGCLLHRARQHGVEWPDPEKLTCCPWMSTLYVDAAVRYYLMTADSRVPRSLVMLGGYMVDQGTYVKQLTAKVPESTFPRRWVSTRWHLPKDDPFFDREHAMDTAKILAAAMYFAKKEGKDDPRYKEVLDGLLLTARWNFELWYSDAPAKFGNPRTRIVPPRKYAWWFRTTADVDWLMNN